MIYVPGQGNPSAKLMLVGEAPGKYEEEARAPFVGPTGKLVNGLLQDAGLSRSQVYCTNVVKIRPPDNKLPRLKELGKSVDDFTPQLWEEINSIEPNCILAIGGLSLKVLTGNDGIKKWRGSILQSIQGYPKIVPTVHPASILHQDSGKGMMSWKDLTYIGADFKRAVEESRTKEIELPSRLITIARSSLDLYRFLDRHKSNEIVTVDIESFKTIPMCIGLAFNRYEAISVPLINVSHMKGSEFAPHELLENWKILTEFFYYKKPKIVGQNFKYDQQKLQTVSRMKIPDPWFDVMAAFSVLYPELPKKLQFISSLLTREPYYKDEYKDFDPRKDKIDQIFIYNGKDAVVEHECMEVLLGELKIGGYEDFFFNHVMKMHRLYSDIEAVGLLVDDARRKELHKKYTAMENAQENEMESLAGFKVNVNSSAKQVPMLLYHNLKIPLRKGTDEETLQGLLNNVVKDGRKRRIIELILSLRKIKKTKSTYINAECGL